MDGTVAIISSVLSSRGWVQGIPIVGTASFPDSDIIRQGTMQATLDLLMQPIQARRHIN